MSELDLKNFVWNKAGADFIVLALADYEGEVLVVYRESRDRSKICIASVDKFCQEFQATYQLF